MAMLRLSGSILHPHNPHGKFPSVSINNNGAIVEVYQPNILSSEICYNVGQLNGEEINISEQSLFLGNGRYPKVAINNENHVVEVHEGRVHRYIYYHIGTIDANNKAVDWHGHVHVHPLCEGRFPAVAMHGDRVVVTYDHAYGSYTTYYCVGNFTADGNDIEWGERNHKIFESYGAAETSVAINEHNIVVAGRGWFNIICRVGRFQGNAIVLTTEIPFSHKGYCPMVCLDNDGYIVMLWQSFTLRKLNYATGKIPNPQQPTIEWPHARHVPLRRYDYGYNPTIAISPDGTKVLEEHETNYAPYRCSLYYHTGTLEKPQLQAQAAQQEQEHILQQAPVQVPQGQALQQAQEQVQEQVPQQHAPQQALMQQPQGQALQVQDVLGPQQDMHLC